MPPWAKFLLQVLPFISVALQDALQYIGEIHASDSATPQSWRHIQMVAKNKLDVDVADYAVTSIDFVNITNGAVDSTWNDADYAVLNTVVGAMMNGWAPHMGSGYQWVEYRSYVRYFNPVTVNEPFAKSGPPERIVPVTTAGTSALTAARQVSTTTTERTPYPRHWGRNYWPFAAGVMADANGYIPQAQVDGFAQVVHDNYLLAAQNELFPVVPVTQIEGSPARGLLGVTELQVDNLPDVIRKRRPKKPTYRKILPVVP